MKTATKQTKQTTPGFSIRIEETTELGDAILIAEFDGGRYQPLGGVLSIAEAKTIAERNMQSRMRDLEAGGEPACPEGFVVWARGLNGEQHVAARWNA